MLEIRRPAVAGTFYYLGREMLEGQVAKLFRQAKGRPRFRAVISPHAGYPYSGKTAARAIASLLPAGTFIILGPNHTGLGKAFSIMSSGEWETPMGRVPIDSGLAGRLRRNPVEEDPLAHYQEHSIEVQLPLLQHRFKEFSFVPIAILNITYGEAFLSDCMKLGKGIAAVLESSDKTGLVVSSDFSHYVPLDEAAEKDRLALETIMALDPRGLFRVLSETGGSVCGFGPIAALLAAARELGLKPEMIHSSTSAEALGDRSSVVTYHALGFG
jgi:hypothetical protein